MKIVIDIDENIYHRFVNGFANEGDAYLIEQLFTNGTPLPKGHGDLIDKNEIIKRYEKDCGRKIYVDNFIHDVELNIPTIIEADKETDNESSN